MLAGVGGIDSALLVVAADESSNPDARAFRHLPAARRPHRCRRDHNTILSKRTYSTSSAWIEEMVAGSFLAGKPIVPVQRDRTGLDDLRRAIPSVAEVDDRDASTLCVPATDRSCLYDEGFVQ
jgi:translation initiation factor 2 gamma subunit (eIF-2gamma)